MAKGGIGGYVRRALRKLFGSRAEDEARAARRAAREQRARTRPARRARPRPGGKVAAKAAVPAPAAAEAAAEELGRLPVAPTRPTPKVSQLGGRVAPAKAAPAPADPAPAAPPPASPYLGLDPRAYWRSGVAERDPLDPGDIYRPRFSVTRNMRIATAGSCFAQHVGRALSGAGFHVLDAEPTPAGIPDDLAKRFGYRLFSGRYGNIYTTRQLAQIFDEAEGRFTPALPVWRRGDRFFDAQRPGVEPDGLASEEEVLRHRASHLARLRPMFREANVFVFTFGLTEAWVHRESGTVYPTAPGTIAGTYDPEVFAFRNFDAFEVLEDFERFRAGLRAINPKVRFLVTVSPVPLTATASDAHVEVATCYSKAVLRSVCGMLTARHDDIDYFPSFEIITSQNARGAYYQPNLRNVSPLGVETAMRTFMRAQGVEPGAARPAPAGAPARRRARPAPRQAEDVQCEDALLEAFAR